MFKTNKNKFQETIVSESHSVTISKLLKVLLQLRSKTISKNSKYSIGRKSTFSASLMMRGHHRGRKAPSLGVLTPKQNSKGSVLSHASVWLLPW